MRDFLRNSKFRSPYFWLSIIGLIFASANIDINTLTSWPLFADALLSIVENPVSIIAVITSMVGIFNDNSSKGLDPIKPKQEEADNDNGE